MYNEAPDKEDFFNTFFDKLAGTDQLKKDIQAGLTKAEIYTSWVKELEDFKEIRAQYLIYPDWSGRDDLIKITHSRLSALNLMRYASPQQY